MKKVSLILAGLVLFLGLSTMSYAGLQDIINAEKSGNLTLTISEVKKVIADPTSTDEELVKAVAHLTWFGPSPHPTKAYEAAVPLYEQIIAKIKDPLWKGEAYSEATCNLFNFDDRKKKGSGWYDAKVIEYTKKWIELGLKYPNKDKVTPKFVKWEIMTPAMRVKYMNLYIERSKANSVWVRGLNYVYPFVKKTDFTSYKEYAKYLYSVWDIVSSLGINQRQKYSELEGDVKAKLQTLLGLPDNFGTIDVENKINALK